MKKVALLLLSIIAISLISEIAVQAGCLHGSCSILGRQRRLERRAARQEARQEARANGYFSLGIWK